MASLIDNILSTCKAVGGNYIEIHLGKLPSNHSNYDVFEHSLEKDLFDRLISMLSRKYERAFEHDFMETVKGDTVLVRKFEDGNIVETRVNNIQVLDQWFDAIADSATNALNIMIYDKKKVPVIMFPSTSSVHSVKYIRRLIFRINNRVYVNLQEEKFCDSLNDIYFRAYVNINYSEGIDNSDITGKVCGILKVFNDILRPTS